MRTTELAKGYERYLIPVYHRLGVSASRAKGSYLWDLEGRRYLDFFPGWGTHALGHGHPVVVEAVRRQLKRLIHVPNTLYHEPQARLAQRLAQLAFDGKGFFTNSGAEAVEAAIKLVRAFGRPHRWEIIVMEGSFHGRTFGAMAATGQVKIRKGFEPHLAGFKHVPFNRIEAVEEAIRRRTAAVMIELVQGEGGIHVADSGYIQALRRLCRKRRLLLIFDEISTGMGRTGCLFCFQHYRVIPDILLLAKPVAGGLPMGVLWAKRSIADCWQKASHATTFGGNPLVAAAGLATLEFIQRKKLYQDAQKAGDYLMGKLRVLQERFGIVREVRGMGLMIGMELTVPGANLVQAALRKGLLINCTQETVIRLYPALTVTRAQIDQAVRILEETLEEVAR